MGSKFPVRKFLIALVLFLSLACSAPFLGNDQNLPPEDSPGIDSPLPVSLDCQEDIDCFIQAAQACQEATVMYAFTLDFMGAMITTTSALEIQGQEIAECVFHIKTELVDISFSDEAMQQMKDSGLSDEDIASQKQMMADSAMEAGYDDTCRGSGDDLATMLTNWEAGNISTEDWEPFTCEGKIFTQTPIEFVTEEAPPEATIPPTEEQPGDGNMLLNASFEQDPETTETRWQVETRGTNLAAHWSMDFSKLGSYALHLSVSTSGNQGWPGWFTVDPVPIEGEIQYIFSTWAYTPDGVDAWVSMALIDADGKLISERASGCMDIEENTWSKVQVSVLPKDTAGVAGIRLGMRQCLNNTAGTTTHLYFDDIYFGQILP